MSMTNPHHPFMQALFIVISWVIPVLLVSGLAAPAALREKSWRRFFIGFGLVLVVVMLPLFVYLLSSFMVPEWKGGCRHGWLDCFMLGKLALAPLVLWATAALYAVEVLRVQNKTRPWIVLGLFAGALVSGGCLGLGLWIATGANGGGEMCLWFLVPLYVFIWHTVRAHQLLRAANTSFIALLATVASTVPFWIVSFWWAKKTYFDLPDQAPTCFVVTAAGRGHERIVGPFMEIQRRGERRRVNQQLVTFWQFENLWSARAPRSHAAFRRIYNRIGPVIAGKINSPLTADVAYVVLKPFEFVARIATARAANFTVMPMRMENHSRQLK